MPRQLTQAELLFGAAAGESDLGVAVAEPEARAPYVPGPRSALVPAECPNDFADLAPWGGQLLRVTGPPTFPQWAAEYALLNETRSCPWCQKEIRAEDPHKSVSIIPDRENPRRYTLRWAHALCAAEAGGSKITKMATFQTTSGMPDCALCGKSYPEHMRYVTTVWDAVCAVDLPGGEYQWYQLSAPIRSRNWPYRLIVSSPYHGEMYGETEDEAVERLKREAA